MVHDFNPITPEAEAIKTSSYTVRPCLKNKTIKLTLVIMVTAGLIRCGKLSSNCFVGTYLHISSVTWSNMHIGWDKLMGQNNCPGS